MSIDSSPDSATQQPALAGARVTIPWLTVLPLAIVMAYADGFWMTSLRDAVGAIERTQQPFSAWLRESTLVVPLYVFAVLGALTLALRWFGPVLRGGRSVVATALLVVAAGSTVGVALIVASSIYDYVLQSDQLTAMNSMHGICVGDCLAQAQQATIWALVRAVLYISGFVLATNLVLVGWLVAMWGGRLRVSGKPRPAAGAAPNRLDDVRLLLIAVLLGSAHIHVAVFPGYLTGWPAAGLFFLALAAAEIILVALLLGRRAPRGALIAAVIIAVGPLLLWLCSRTAGLPIGPGAGVRQSVGLADALACTLEILTLITAIALVRAGNRLRRPSVSAHQRGLVLVAVLALTALGIGGAAPSWFDGLSSDTETVTVHTH